jgi:hypothetical protein
MKIKSLITIFIMTLIIVACSNKEQLNFNNLVEAEKEIGEIKTPDMPEGYNIKKITYDNDGFTHPVTKVFYVKGEQRITFMIASSWFDNSPSEKVYSESIEDFKWITKNDEYVLKWRNSNKESYRYLFTTDKKDKQSLIAIAESL